MTEEEVCLLSLKAMGYRPTTKVQPWGSVFYLTGFHNEQAEWRPTVTPENTLRMIQYLGLSVVVTGDEVVVSKGDIVVEEYPSDNQRQCDNKHGAICVAVAKVAAEIGRNMSG